MSHVHRIDRGASELDCPDCLAREEEVKRLLVALRYIERPSVGTPAHWHDDLDGWIKVVPARNVRIALAACIRVAREALSSLDP